MAVGRRGGNTPAPPTAASCWSDMQTWFNNGAWISTALPLHLV